MQLSPEEMKKREDMFNTMCICRGCPTYRGLGKQDEYIAYCFANHGRSKTIADEKGCYCGICSVYKSYRYLTNYYCTRGLESEQKQAIAREVQTGQNALDYLRHR